MSGEKAKTNIQTILNIAVIFCVKNGESLENMLDTFIRFYNDELTEMNGLVEETLSKAASQCKKGNIPLNNAVHQLSKNYIAASNKIIDDTEFLDETSLNSNRKR